MHLTKEQVDFWEDYFKTEVIATSNEINSLAKQLPEHKWDSDAYNRLIERIKQLIYKREEAHHKWKVHRKISDGYQK